MKQRARSMDEHVLLLCDVVDSTALTERLGDKGAAEFWNSHDHTARELLQSCRGREVDKTDGLFALFESVDAAMAFAAAYHAALSAMAPPLQARVAIHRGPVLVRRTSDADVARGAKRLDVDGMAKPIAARMGALALPGQTLLSDTAAAAIQSGPRLVALGHWRFKGIAEPIALFEPAALALGPPPDAEKAWRVTYDGERWLPTKEVPSSLPAERDGFVGRRTLLGEIASAFEGRARLVTLLGVGGSGKTRLALRHGWDALGGHPGGVWFCDLSQAVTFDGIVHAVAQGLRLPLGVSDPMRQIGDAIASRGTTLIILDNFEQVARHAEASVGRWLEHAKAATFLVTSREVLGITGERTIAIPPLPTEDAVDLFVQRARAASSAFTAGHVDESAISELVRLLDGLPLSIELAASRVRVMTPRAMVARMGERFRLLATPGGRRDRQATLRATLDWSWDLLSDAERAALIQLSVFEGGFTLESAEAVVDFSAISDPPWTVDVVHALVQKSWVRRLTETRFDLLRTIQDYVHLAMDRTSDGQQALYRRHAHYFATLSEAAAIADRYAEADNLVVACRRATESGNNGDALGNLVNAWEVLLQTGPLTLALELANAVSAMPDWDAEGKARAEIVSASALDAMGRSAEAQDKMRGALAQLPLDSAAAARARCVLAEALLNLGELDGAEREFSAALKTAGELGELKVQCRAHNAMGVRFERQSHPDRARPHYERALELAKRLGDKRWQGGLLGNIAVLDHMSGRTLEARRNYERALALAAETGDRRWEANTRCNLGVLLNDEGQTDDALVHLEAAITAARHMGHRMLEGTALCNLGLLHESRNELDAAGVQLEHAVSIAEDCRDERNEGLYRAYLGLVLARLGRSRESLECFAKATKLVEGKDNVSNRALLASKRATALLVLGDKQGGSCALGEAESLIAEGGFSPGPELASALSVARNALGTL